MTTNYVITTAGLIRRFEDLTAVDRIDLAYYGHDSPARHNIAYNHFSRWSGYSDNQYIAVSASYLRGARYPMTYIRTDNSHVNISAPMQDKNYFGISKEEMHNMLMHLAYLRQEEPEARIGHSIMIFRKSQMFKTLIND